MIFQLKANTPNEVVQELRTKLETVGVRTRLSSCSEQPIFAAVDKVPLELNNEISGNKWVLKTITPKGAWRLADFSFQNKATIANIGDVLIGGQEIVIIAGPCSVDAYMDEAAEQVKRAGGHILRGGAYKPRTSPWSFQGFGKEGLKLLKSAGERVNLPVISEIMDASDLPAFLEYGIDCLQIGARNMQNFTLLKAIAGCGTPVLLKRGLSATVEEWLYSAEYLLAGGCQDVILCERGIRTFEKATRNTLDLTILPLLKEWTHLPVIVDPSHAAGIPSLIPPLSRAAVAVGADGLAIEIHPDPSQARSDADQALLENDLAKITADARVLGATIGRQERSNSIAIP